MHNKAKAGIAAAAVGALALGGATFALWSDSASVAGGSITSGNLDIAAVSTAYHDVSPDRVDGPHVINDIGTWKAVPGDVIETRTGLDLALVGDNLVAELNNNIETAIIAAGAEDHVTVTTEIRNAAGTVVSTGASGVYRVQAGGTGQAAGVDDPDAMIVPAVLDGVADYTAVVTVAFDEATPDQVLTNAALTDAISGSDVSLDQVRTGGGFN